MPVVYEVWMIGGHGSHQLKNASYIARGISHAPTPPHRGDDEISEWDGFVPLLSSEVRSRSRWRLPGSRRAFRGAGRRQTAIISVLATIIFLAACVSAVRSIPDGVDQPTSASPSLASHTSASKNADSDANERPLPKWRPLRTARASEPGNQPAAPNASLVQAPFKDASSVLGATQLPSAATTSVHDQNPRRPPPIFGERGYGASEAITELVAFDSAPFPYDGLQPQGGPFIDVIQNGQRGHRNRRGKILWESTTFNDRRVLVHIPAGFDADRPAVIVVFFHGFGATLTRDVLARQQVPAQISASGSNAILLAPQFAVDARDASAGRFWQSGGFSRFLREAAGHVAQMRGGLALQRRLAKAPIVLIAYSGGFVPAAWSLKDVEASNRVRGVVLLDAAYGELERFAHYAASNRSSFLISASSRFTQPQNGELAHMLASQGVPATSQMSATLSSGGAIFLSTGPGASHENYVTQAWTRDPIKDVLTRLPEFRLHDPQTVASVDRSIVLSQSEDAPRAQ